MCAKGEDQKIRERLEYEVQASMKLALKTYVSPFKMANSFKYLWRFLTTSDENWPAVVANIWKARRIWERFPSILGQDEENLWNSGKLYN